MNITLPRYTELLAAEKALKEREEIACIAPFVAHMLENIGVCLANTQFWDWPEVAQLAYKNSALKFPVPAQIYKERLP